jgi:hypothetical protein
MDKKEYYKDYITKGVAQEVVKDVFRVDTITQEIIDICMKCMIAIKNAPTADVRENVRGEWIKKKGSLWTLATCSVCGELSVEGDKHFCPNCGARMSNPCADCQEFDCYGCEYKKGEES